MTETPLWNPGLTPGERLRELLDAEGGPLDADALLAGLALMGMGGEYVPCPCRLPSQARLPLPARPRTPRAVSERAKTPSEITLSDRPLDFRPPECLSEERREAALASISFARNARHGREAVRLHRKQILSYGRGGDSFYTPEMLRRFLEWEGDACAFPLCDEPQAEPRWDRSTYRPGTNWHLCDEHQRCLLNIFDNERQRRRGRTEHGTTARENTDA